MKVSELQPRPLKNILFQRNQYLLVPALSGCYVLANTADAILYIGQTLKINQRFQQHLNSPEKIQPTREGIAWKFWFLEYDSKKLSFLENSWLQEFLQKEGRLPLGNKIQAPL
jgi:excinuclease UvrABC nuclease subunit